jgi:hypothetical protein
MSKINGDKARYEKNRRRKLQQRDRTRALVAKLTAGATGDSAPAKTASRKARPAS